MICCYLLHSGQFDNAADALKCYDEARTMNRKGVTIPSQKRYVEYYAQLMKIGRPYCKIEMNICEIRLFNFPKMRFTSTGNLSFTITANRKEIYSDHLTDLSKRRNADKSIVIKLDRCMKPYGDVKIEFVSTLMKHKTKLFHFWFNTFFINETQNCKLN